MRDAIDSEYAGSPLFPLLLTSLIEAADRVDSTTGVQMAYVKQWAPRSFKPLELRVPELLDGPGRAIQGDAVALAASSGSPGAGALRPGISGSAVQPAPVFHQLSRVGDAGGLGCARGLRRGPQAAGFGDPSTHSVFNSKRTMPAALASVVQSVDCDLLVLSYNDESWLEVDELEAMCAIQEHRRVDGGTRRDVATLSFDSARYVGARIGIFDPSGRKVGRVSHLSNQELLVIAGEPAMVRRVVEAVGKGAAKAAAVRPAERSALAVWRHRRHSRRSRPAPRPSWRQQRRQQRRRHAALLPMWSPPVWWIGYNRQREQARSRWPRQRLP